MDRDEVLEMVDDQSQYNYDQNNYDPNMQYNQQYSQYDQNYDQNYTQQPVQSDIIESNLGDNVGEIKHVSVDPESWRGLLRPASAELLGSALFVFIACGSAMSSGAYHSVGAQAIGISLTFGTTILVLAFAIGHISGGHLNFAVTFAFAILGKISLRKAGLYFLGQFLGGLIGIGFLKLVTPPVWWNNCFAANFVHGELTVGHAFVAEFILTFMLMFVVMAACDPTKSNQVLVPYAIGMAVFIAHMLGLPITGCSINPTRTFASAAAASGIAGCEYVWRDMWVFWFAPIAGATAAGFLYELLFNAGGGLIEQYIASRRED